MAVLPAADASKAFVVTRSANGEHTVSSLEISLGICTKRTRLATDSTAGRMLGHAAISEALLALAFQDRLLVLNSKTHKLVAEVRQKSGFAANPRANLLGFCRQLRLLLWWTEDSCLQTVSLESFHVTSKLCNLFASAGSRALPGHSLVCFATLEDLPQALLLSTGNPSNQLTLYDLAQRKISHTVQILPTRSLA